MKIKILFADFQPQPSSSNSGSGSRKKRIRKAPKVVKSHFSAKKNDKTSHESDTKEKNSNGDDGE